MQQGVQLLQGTRARQQGARLQWRARQQRCVRAARQQVAWQQQLTRRARMWMQQRRVQRARPQQQVPRWEPQPTQSVQGLHAAVASG